MRFKTLLDSSRGFHVEQSIEKESLKTMNIFFELRKLLMLRSTESVTRFRFLTLFSTTFTTSSEIRNFVCRVLLLRL